MNLKSVALFAIVWLTACSSPNKESEKKETTKNFSLPEIPAMLIVPEERAQYLLQHYWDKYDFSDTALVANSEITEQAFVNFVDLFSHASSEIISTGIYSLLDKALSADSLAFARFTELADKYLYDPNSPFRNEDAYIQVLRYIVESPRIDNIQKVRPQFQLDLALKNRIGEVANDFTYTLADGKNGKLSTLRSDFTLIFFNNPDCTDCKRVKEYIERSHVLNNRKQITILALYPDEELEAWRKTVYPDGWINSYDALQTIRTQNSYDLRAIPCLYLLDRDKRVLLKDAPVEKIETYLAEK